MRSSSGRVGSFFVDLGGGVDVVRLAPTRPDITVTVTGGAGTDTADFGRHAGGVAVSLAQAGIVQDVGIAARAGFVALAGIEGLIGTGEADRLTGDGGANRLDGGGGNDTLAGQAGNDTLLGLAGADVLSGGEGDDVLRGGKRNDTLTGGAGADDFVFGRREGTDRITDFELGLDNIAIAGVTRLGQITFTDTAAGARLSANGTTIIVEDVTVAEIRDADNFVF